MLLFRLLFSSTTAGVPSAILERGIKAATSIGEAAPMLLEPEPERRYRMLSSPRRQSSYRRTIEFGSAAMPFVCTFRSESRCLLVSGRGGIEETEKKIVRCNVRLLD